MSAAAPNTGSQQKDVRRGRRDVEQKGYAHTDFAPAFGNPPCSKPVEATAASTRRSTAEEC